LRLFEFSEKIAKSTSPGAGDFEALLFGLVARGKPTEPDWHLANRRIDTLPAAD
jgi:hypothetical protein